MKGGKQNSTTCNTTWKNKGHQKRISYKSDAFVEEYSFTTAATVIKYLQAALALSSEQLMYKHTDPHHVQPRRHHDPDGPHLMQHPHLASHCLGAYKPTELPVLHCVQRYFFSPTPFSFLSHSSQHPQKRVAPRTTDCFTVKAIVGRPHRTGNSFAFPFPENISP